MGSLGQSSLVHRLKDIRSHAFNSPPFSITARLAFAFFQWVSTEPWCYPTPLDPGLQKYGLTLNQCPMVVG